MSTSHLFIFNGPPTPIDLHQFVDIHYRFYGPCSEIRTHQILRYRLTPARPRRTGTRTAIILILLFLWRACFLLRVHCLHILCPWRCHQILCGCTILWDLSVMVVDLRHVGRWMILIMSLELLVIDVLTSPVIWIYWHLTSSYLLNLL